MISGSMGINCSITKFTESIRLLNNITKLSRSTGRNSGNDSISPVISKLNPEIRGGNIVSRSIGRFVTTDCIIVLTAVSRTGRYCTAIPAILLKKTEILALNSAPVLSTPVNTSANAASTPAYPFLKEAAIGIADCAILEFASFTACSAFS